jgi:hypothetical protein
LAKTLIKRKYRLEVLIANQFKHRVRKNFRHFLRHVVSSPGHNAVVSGAFKVKGLC